MYIIITVVVLGGRCRLTWEPGYSNNVVCMGENLFVNYNSLSMPSIKSFKLWFFLSLGCLFRPREARARKDYLKQQIHNKNTHSGHWPFQGHSLFYKETILCFCKIICSKCVRNKYSRTQQDVCFGEYQHVDPRHKAYLLCSKKHISELL